MAEFVLIKNIQHMDCCVHEKFQNLEALHCAYTCAREVLT